MISVLSQAGHINDGFTACNTVLKIDPDNIDATIDKAETYLANEEYDEGNICIHLYEAR